MYTCIAGHIASLYHACDYCNCESPTGEATDSRVGANTVDNVFKVCIAIATSIAKLWRMFNLVAS